jgi:MFS family permease
MTNNMEQMAHSPRVFPVVLAGFTAFLDLFITQPLLPMLATLFHATRFAVSLTIAAPTVAVALAAPLAGRLGDRFGRRRIIVWATFGLAATTGLAATSTTLAQLIAWRFLQGLFTPGVFAVTVAYVHDQWPPGKAGSATSAYVSGTILGGLSGRIASGVISSALGWRAAFLIVAAVNFLAWTALWLWLPADRPVRASGGALQPVRDRWLHLTHPDLLATYIVGFGVLFSIVATFTYVTFHLAAPPYELSTAALGYLFNVYLAGANTGRTISSLNPTNGAVAWTRLGCLLSSFTLPVDDSAPCIAGDRVRAHGPRRNATQASISRSVPCPNPRR